MTEKRKGFKIKMPIMAMGDVSVVIDGVDLTNQISSLTLRAAVGELTELTVTFLAGVDIEGEAILKLLGHEGKPLEKENED